MCGERKDVVQSAVICHKNLRMVEVDILQAFNFNTGPAKPEVIPGPTTHAVVLKPATARYQAAQMDTVAQKAVLSAHPVQHQIVNSLARIFSIPENLPQEP